MKRILLTIATTFLLSNAAFGMTDTIRSLADRGLTDEEIKTYLDLCLEKETDGLPNSYLAYLMKRRDPKHPTTQSLYKNTQTPDRSEVTRSYSPPKQYWTIDEDEDMTPESIFGDHPLARRAFSGQSYPTRTENNRDRPRSNSF